MKRIVLCLLGCTIFFGLNGCARHQVEFVPLTLQWFSYSGSFSFEAKPLPIADSLKNRCMIALTGSLMRSTPIQAHKDENIRFRVQYYSTLKDQIDFIGALESPQQQNLEKTPLTPPSAPAPEYGYWKATCDSQGSIRILKFEK